MPTNSLKSYFQQDSELKAHSSALTNERINILIALYDQSMLNANNSLNINQSRQAVTALKQIWKSFRPNVYNDPYCRRDLNLETKVDGIYYPDIILNKLYSECIRIEFNPKLNTTTNVVRINQAIEEIEEVIRNVLQFFKFTFRLQTKLKPDIAWANSKMIDMIDERTENELFEMAGKRLQKSRKQNEVKSLESES